MAKPINWDASMSHACSSCLEAISQDLTTSDANVKLGYASTGASLEVDGTFKQVFPFLKCALLCAANPHAAPRSPSGSSKGAAHADVF